MILLTAYAGRESAKEAMRLGALDYFEKGKEPDEFLHRVDKALVEKSHILQTLERCGWNHSRAAEALGIGRTSLWRKLEEYQIEERLR